LTIKASMPIINIKFPAIFFATILINKYAI